MNKVVLSGRVTADIAIKYTAGENSNAYVRFNLAVPRRKKDETDFIACQAWNKTAELLDKYVKKGDKIIVEGFIRTGQYEKNGQKIFTTDVVVENIEFCQSKSEGKPVEKRVEKPTQEQIEGFAQLDEDFPF